MKPGIIAFTIVLSSVNLSAQLEKGRSMINGSISFNQNKVSVQDTRSGRIGGNGGGSYYNIALGYGYFIKENVVLGISGNTTSYNSRNTNNFLNGYYNSSVYRSMGYGANIFMRYYKPTFKNKLAFFAGLSTGYNMTNGTQETKSGYNGNVDSYLKTNNVTNGFSLRFYPGLVYFVNRVLAIETTFGNAGYNFQQTKYYRSGKLINTSNTGSFNSNINFTLSSLTFGINFYFGHALPNDVKKEKQ